MSRSVASHLRVEKTIPSQFVRTGDWVTDLKSHHTEHESRIYHFHQDVSREFERLRGLCNELAV